MDSSSANTSSDPYSIPWTDTQRMRNELDDLETQQNDLLVLNGGYMTTDILPQYRAYQDQIDQLNKKLAGVDTSVQNVAAPMNTPGRSGRFATLGDAYADLLEQEGVVFKDSAVNSNAEANGVNPSDPYSIPWTEEQEKRKRLSDAQIQRDNLLGDMGDNPTKEDIIAWSQYDATIKQLTQELGLGPKEYTPGGKIIDGEQHAQGSGGGYGGGMGAGSWGNEYNEKAGEKIQENAQYIIDAANYYGVDPKVVAGVIYAEQSLNMNILDFFTETPHTLVWIHPWDYRRYSCLQQNL